MFKTFMLQREFFLFSFFFFVSFPSQLLRIFMDMDLSRNLFHLSCTKVCHDALYVYIILYVSLTIRFRLGYLFQVEDQCVS